MRETAQRAFEMGWNIIPVHALKGPHSVLIQTGHCEIREGRKVPVWRPFQQERVTSEMLDLWFDPRWKVPGLAAVTGAISNLVVLDFDGQEGQTLCRSWGLRPNALSGSGCPHVYFTHPGHRVPNAASGALLSPPFPGLDVRGDGGMIVLPPSLLKNGQYRQLHTRLHQPGDLPEAAAIWTRLTQRKEIELPPLTAELPADLGIDTQAVLAEALSRAGGGRDNSGYARARQLLSAGLSQSEAMRVMEQYAQQVPQTDSRGRHDPYTVRDAKRNLLSAAQQGPGKSSRRNLKNDLNSRIKSCLPSLQSTEREELSRLLAATLLREGHPDPKKVLRDFGLNQKAVQTIQDAMEQQISVRGKAALIRFLEQRWN